MESTHILTEQIEELELLLAEIKNSVRLLSEDEETREAAAEHLYRLNEIKRELATLYKDYEQSVLPYFRREYLMADGTTLETRGSTSRKAWNHRELASKVAERIVEESFDFETGEMSRSFEEMVQELLKYAGIGYWKKTVEDIGLDLDQYSDSEFKETVSIRRPK